MIVYPIDAAPQYPRVSLDAIRADAVAILMTSIFLGEVIPLVKLARSENATSVAAYVQYMISNVLPDAQWARTLTRLNLLRSRFFGVG
jgi:hypothetical protein